MQCRTETPDYRLPTRTDGIRPEVEGRRPPAAKLVVFDQIARAADASQLANVQQQLAEIDRCLAEINKVTGLGLTLAIAANVLTAKR